MAEKAFPKNPAEWRAAIENGLKISNSLLQAAYNRGEFPLEALEAWIQETYKEG